MWRVVDHEGKVLEVVATKRRHRRAALRKLLCRYGRPEAMVTDWLPSYGAAMQAIGCRRRHVCRDWRINNRAENSHQPFRPRERAVLRFRRMGTLQKCATVHGSVSNHFNLPRHLTSRPIYKRNRTAACVAWQQLLA